VPELNIRRNTALLAATLAINSCLFQLAAAVNSLTFVLITGITGLLGLGPAIFLASSGVAALPAGRAMDRFGRVPVLAGGFLIGALGTATTALACAVVQAPLVIVGFALLGASQGIVLLARTAAVDMYPPDRRARGISFVLFGAVFGALLGPFVFGPLFSGRDLDTDALVVPWLAAGAFMVVGLALVLALGLASAIGSRGTTIGVLVGLQVVVMPFLLQINALGSVRELLPVAATERLAPAVLFDGSPTVPMSAGVAILVLAAWTVLPLAAGAWRTVTRDA
jgi:MFS family permease